MSAGGGKAKSQTVGYRYSMALHMGLTLGAIDELVEVQAGGKTIYPREVDGALQPTITESGEYQIKAASIFGGDKKEGGIDGRFVVMMGEEDQVVPGWIASLLGGLVPSFRNVTTFFFDGLITSLNPYPKEWKFRSRRVLAGWDGPVWRPDLAAVWLEENKICAMNGAHILYQCATDRVWGRGLPRAMIDDVAWAEAAQTLFDEGFGLCARWSQDDGLSSFVKTVLDAIGGTIYVDQTTGLLTLKLFRQDYDPDTIPHFTYDSGLLELTQTPSGASEVSVNEVIVAWHDPIKNAKREVRAQNLAAMQSKNGARNTRKTDYSTIPTAALADRVAWRDLKIETAGGKVFKMKFDRRARHLAPGKVFSISVPDQNITKLVLRTGLVRVPAQQQGPIEVEALLDVFGLSATQIGASEGGGWVPPNYSAIVPSVRRLREATWRDLVRSLTEADLNTVHDDAGTVVTIAMRPTYLAEGYNLNARVQGADEEFVSTDRQNWSGTAFLAAPIGPYDTEVLVQDGVDLDEVVFPCAIEIDGEILLAESSTSTDGIEGSLVVKRGCVDTIPAAHGGGSPVYFTDNVGYVDREFVIGETVEVKLLTVTSTEVLKLEDAPLDIIEVVARQNKPIVPGNLRVNGALALALAGSILGDIVFTWAHRDRILQSDKLVEHGYASIGPETGTSYRIRVYDAVTNALLRSVEGILGDTWTYTEDEAFDDGNRASLRFVLDANRDGVTSFASYSVPVVRIVSPGERTFADSFNRPDVADIAGPMWTKVAGLGTAAIVSQRVNFTTTGGTLYTGYKPASPGSNRHFVTIKTAFTVSMTSFPLVVRFQDISNFIGARWTSNSGGRWEVYRRVSGTLVLIGSAVQATVPAAATTMTLESDGVADTVKLKINGVTVVSIASVGVLAASTDVGIIVRSAEGPMLDNFACGVLS